MLPRRFHSILGVALIAWAIWSGHPDAAHALAVTGYSAPANDRFSSGYSSGTIGTLVSNTSSSFVGLGYDWSGVGWNASDLVESFGMISPRHYLFAEHNVRPAWIQFYGTGGELYSDNTNAHNTGRNTGCGPVVSGFNPDISLGTLSASIPTSAQITYYPILDLVTDLTGTSSYSSNYANLPLLIYGMTGRIASNTAANASIAVYYINSGLTLISGTNVSALEIGDSGSPVFSPWTNPNTSSKQLALVGYNWASGTVNFHAFVPANDVSAKLNTFMAVQGYALRWVGKASSTWTGSSSATLSLVDNWSSTQVPTDVYVTFAGNLASNRALSLGTDRTLRGLAFLTANAGKLFTFQAGNTLTLGRGGIVNYDANNRQSFACNITLSDAQWWESGTGGLTVSGGINNGGHLLVVDGAGSTQLSGIISGTGGLAKEGAGMLTLSGNTSFSGPLFVHNGTLNLTGVAGGVGAVNVETGGTLQGSGQLTPSSSNNIILNGILSPGDATTSGTLATAFTSGTLAFGSTGTLVFNAGTSSDLVRVPSGTVALGGTLQIVQSAGFSYANSYTIFSGLGAAPTGSFGAVTGLATGFNQAFSTTNGNYTVRFVPTTYAAWQQAHFTAAEIASGLADDAADPDSDSIQNLTEYALALDPRIASSLAASIVTTSGTHLTLTVTKNPNATDLTYTVEVTSDLTNSSSWTTTGITVTETATTLTAQDQTAVADAPRRFMRLRVTRQ